MSRLPWARSRSAIEHRPPAPRATQGALVLALAAATVVAGSAPALAQLGPPQPVIDSAPRAVGFKRTAVVKGHLENGSPGDEVTLERAPAGREFKPIATKLTDENGAVTFRVKGLNRTADYRLAWNEEVSGARTTSEVRKIRVRPKLRMRMSRNNVMRGRSAVVRGGLRPALPGRDVVIQRRVNGKWRTVTRAAAGDGRYRARLRFNDIGRERLRARFRGDGHNTRRTLVRGVRVYDPEPATWYGPGFYGNRTACGRRLGYSTLGVAHRSLPCGTEIDLLYEGRTVSVRVIDRGPYSSADWDLTRETADRLNFSGRDRVGVVRGG
ncbi:MAG: septal ring lytic transglycosylase RlpA family protein [Actinomycetota bacterium]